MNYNLGYDPIQQLFHKKIRKQTRAHVISRDKIVGHSLAIGNPGHGKTSGNRREVELRWACNHKIFCLYDAGRMDMAYFMFPSVSPFWKKPKMEHGKIVTARRYPVKLLYPVTKDLPDKIPNAGVAFTIPVADLDETDMVAMAGAGAKDMIKGLFTYMERMVNDYTSPEDYINIMGAAMRKVKDTDGIKPSHHAVKKLKFDVLQPLISQGILSSRTAPTALDLEAEIRDKNTITVLVLRHCPQNLWGFLVHYFMNHLFKILAGIGRTKRVKQKTTIVLNEVADLISNDDESGGSSWSISKTIGRIAKQSRTSDMFMLLDTQIPQELPDVKDTMQRIYVYNSGRPEVEKAMEIIGISTRSGEITTDDLMIIPRLDRGWYYLFDRETGVSIHKQVWTRSRTYLSGEDFYDIYDKVCGKSAYTNIKALIAELRKDKEKSEAAWEMRNKIVSGELAREVNSRKKLIPQQSNAEPEDDPDPADELDLPIDDDSPDQDELMDGETEKPRPKRKAAKRKPSRPAKKPATKPAVSVPAAKTQPQPVHAPQPADDDDWGSFMRILPTLGK